MPHHSLSLPWKRLAPAAVALAVAAGLAPQSPAAATPVPAGAARVVVEGEGYGHGHGMSQYGAKVAAERGVGHRAILRHYYPGTSFGKVGGRIKVLITADRTPDLQVVSRTGLKAKVVGTKRTWRLGKVKKRAARTASRWRAKPLRGGRTALQYKKGGWRRLAVVKGSLEFTAGGRPVTLVARKGHRVAYRGTLRLVPGSRGGDTVNIVKLEQYLQGVVPQEVPALWPAEAVRAQAVAARSYAAYERRYDSHGAFDVYDTTADQVYGGASAEHPAASRAIRATRRVAVMHRGAPAFTQFSSSNGGWMLAGSMPYLVSGRDAYDPVNRWRVVLPLRAFQQRWPSAGRITDLAVTTHPRAGTWVDTVTITGTGGTYTISGDDFRSWAGLRSASFRLKPTR